MPKCMQHWNGNQVCVIDTETTGLEPGWHDIVQVCILPLDSNFEPRQDVIPFYLNLKPDSPERADPEALKINGLKLAELAIKGIDTEKAKDLLDAWIEKLDLPYTKYGNRKRIIPLGQNYSFDLGFMKAWLGVDRYGELFDYHYRDTMPAALYLNDRAAMHAESVPFPKVNLRYLASTLKIPYERKHDALEDCRVTAIVYKRMVEQGLLG